MFIVRIIVKKTLFGVLEHRRNTIIDIFDIVPVGIINLITFNSNIFRLDNVWIYIELKNDSVVQRKVLA